MSVKSMVLVIIIKNLRDEQINDSVLDISLLLQMCLGQKLQTDL